MKKTSIILGMLAMGFFANAQVTRMSLYEEFTGENCPPCAATNPGLDALISANSSKVIMIKWQVPIPSAPSNTWSLYQTGKNMIDWRWRPTSVNGYGYPCTVCSPTAAYINSAPNGRMDGQELNAFGLTGTSANHPGNLTAAAISSAQAQTTPFSINFATPVWDAAFNTATVTATVTAQSAFTSVGALKFRLVLVERTVNFPSAPGTNGEVDFHEPIRYAYNTTPAVPTSTITDFGVVMNSSWAAASSTVLTWTCTVPSYVYDKGQMSFVGFIQDDGNKKVWQAARTNQPSIPNDAKAMSVSVNSVACSTTMAPTATIKNNGSNAITAFTVTPYMNSVAGTDVVWTGNLAPGATTVINMGTQTIGNGTNVFSVTVSGVSGGDVVMSNNGTSASFFNTSSYGTTAINEGFVNTSYPPAGWAYFNNANAQYTWQRATGAGGFGTSSEATRVFINWTPTGGTHDLFMPGTSFTGTMYPTLKFDLSYTQITSSNTDKLQVWASTNCGATWTSVWVNQGTAMATTPTNSTSLNVPAASGWSAVTVPMYSYSNTPGVLVKFTATGGGGNVIWLDNINLFDQSTTGINEAANAAIGFDVYPNPANNEFNVWINSTNAMSTSLKVVNTLGQVVINKNVTLNAGNNNIQIDAKQLASGIYYVSFDSAKGSMTKKLTITK